RRARAQRSFDVIAIQPARDEAVLPLVVAVPREPRAEVLRLVREGAHRVGPGVEQVRLVARAVRDAAGQTLAGLAERDLEAIVTAAQQMSGERGAAESAPDDHDMILLAHGAASCTVVGDYNDVSRFGSLGQSRRRLKKVPPRCARAAPYTRKNNREIGRASR